MPKYRITPAGRETCYVTNEDIRPPQQLWDGVLVIYSGAGKPLQYRGPFDIPAAVQSQVAQLFESGKGATSPYWVVDVMDTPMPYTSDTATPAADDQP